MTTLISHIWVKQGMEGKFEALMQEMYRRTKAHEPLNIHYELMRGKELGHYYHISCYYNEDAFWHHQNAWYHQKTGLAECFDRPVEVEFVEPVQGATKMPENDKVLREKAGITHPEAERQGY